MLTNYVGELLQHDTSHHLWSPYAEKKWYLITTIDDYSRAILYADFWEAESSWAHLVVGRYVTTHYGCPQRYYVDNHSIFRFVERRDTLRRKAQTTEENANVQWRQVLNILRIDIIYALSPAAKGKVERPYRWLQDHVVRECSHQGVKEIEEGRKILHEEVHQYNYKRVHSTTGEIPMVRFEKSLQENKTLFRPLNLQKMNLTVDDLFCYRFKRIVDPYRRISLNNMEFALSGVPIHAEIEIRMSFNPSGTMAMLRFWYQGNLVGSQEVKAEDMKKLQD